MPTYSFPDDIVVNAEEEEEADFTGRPSRYNHHKVQNGPDKIKVMKNKPAGFPREIKIKGQ